MRTISLCVVFSLASTAWAGEAAPVGAAVEALSVHPARIELDTPYAYAQVIVTASLADGSTSDYTRMVAASAPANVTVSPHGLVRATSPGEYTIVFKIGKFSVSVPVSVRDSKTHNVSFVRDVMPLVSKLGCNAGTCHGAQAGKNGFKLSLRGYDPLFDHRALADDLEGRRFNRAAPERSLLLMKPAGSVPHVGGVLWSPGEPNYELVKDWIIQGVRLDLASTRVKSLEILPKNPTIQRAGEKQQFAVIATYPDGRTRDVSSEAFIDSSNTEVANVDKTGLLTTVRRGEATMLARYEGAYAASTVVVMGDRNGFEWKPQPVNNAIDELVDAKLKRIKVLPSELCTDEEFVRRVTIDLTGIPPGADDVRRFQLSAKGSHIKRAELIDRLIGSEGFIEHWTNKWGDLLQINRKFLGQPGATALRAWVRKAVERNMPYDVFAYSLLTGSGSNIENPTAAYYKILREPDAVMENTTQLFLATRFNCNKCHDHPFERWTQDQYYQLAAYFAQVGRKEDPKYKGQKVGGTAVEKPVPLSELIEDVKEGEVTHIRTGAVAHPAFPFTHAEMPATDLPRRVQAARWITSDKNPYFAKSYVNRVWSYLTGVGLIEPVDDIRAGNPATNPELLDRLTQDFIDSGFDTRKLIRTICNSRTYQLSVKTNPWNKDDDINYSHAIARRLPAEALYDAIYKATGSVSKLPGLPPGARAAQLIDGSVELPGGFLELLGKPPRESVCECERSNTMMLGPVLAFINGPVVSDAVQDGNNAIARFVLENKDDDKVVEEIYLRVFNRFPTKDERESGIKAIRGAAKDHRLLVDDFAAKNAKFQSYVKSLDERQAAWENGLRSQRPTKWTIVKASNATSKAGATPATADKASKIEIRDDGSLFVTGAIEKVDNYTVQAELKEPEPITAIRLEALTDSKLPKGGPGRAVNGNFVLHEFKVNSKPAGKKDAKGKAVKLERPSATIEQDGFAVAGAIDNNPATGWAIANGVGANQAALFHTSGFKADSGVVLTFVFDQRYGKGHTLGRFRLSYTTDKAPRLTTPVTPEELKLLETPVSERSEKEKETMRARYLAKDPEYHRLKMDVSKEPPADARVLGAQDLTWALLNNPAFLFNR